MRRPTCSLEVRVCFLIWTAVYCVTLGVLTLVAYETPTRNLSNYDRDSGEFISRPTTCHEPQLCLKDLHPANPESIVDTARLIGEIFVLVMTCTGIITELVDLQWAHKVKGVSYFATGMTLPCLAASLCISTDALVGIRMFHVLGWLSRLCIIATAILRALQVDKGQRSLGAIAVGSYIAMILFFSVKIADVELIVCSCWLELSSCLCTRIQSYKPIYCPATSNGTQHAAMVRADCCLHIAASPDL